MVSAVTRAVAITGASSRIGLATAERLARAGHLVVLGAPRSEICEETASRLRAEGATAFAAPLDLSDMSSIDEFVDAARYLVGPVDVLVATPEHDMLGVQHLAARLIPVMVDNGRADLVFVSSEVVGPVLQAELEGTGVRASIVRPSLEPGMEPDYVAGVISSVIAGPEPMHLRLVEVVRSVPRTMEATN